PDDQRRQRLGGASGDSGGPAFRQAAAWLLVHPCRPGEGILRQVQRSLVHPGCVSTDARLSPWEETMTEKGILIEEKAARFERVLPGPVERVWEHLTGSEHLPLWFGGSGMKYVIEGREGGKVDLANGHVRGVVTRWEPPSLLSYTCNLSGPHGERLPVYFLPLALQPRKEGQVLHVLI